MDEIALRGMVFYGRHGVNPEETALGQRFGVDLSVWLDLSQAMRSDEIADSVSYADLYKLVRSEVEGEPSKLLEHLAGRVLDRVLARHPQVARVRVQVTKLNPPIKGNTTAAASVTLERTRTGSSR
jgi:dihydroneopterin aldolase